MSERIRISDLCRTKPAPNVYGVRPEFSKYGFNWCSGYYGDVPLGAGIDAPDELPSGSCMVFETAHCESFVAPGITARD